MEIASAPAPTGSIASPFRSLPYPLSLRASCSAARLHSGPITCRHVAGQLVISRRGSSIRQGARARPRAACALHTSSGLVPHLVSSSPSPPASPPPSPLPPPPPSLPRALQQLVGAYHSAAATDGSQAVGKFEDVGPVDPFSLVADELTGLADKMRAMILSEIPKLATAADYFFRVSATGKRFRPTVILLMASSLEHTHCTPPVALSGAPGVPLGEVPAGKVFTAEERRERQRRIAEITEMIHVASLLHDDVLDHADTRRGVSSLNYMMGNKLAVLAGDFLLARASAALAGLRNTEVVELLSAVLEHLVGGEVMQMTAEPTQCSSMEYYMRKTFLKTASLIANSCKAVAVLGGHDAPTAQLAYDYGRHLGLAFQLVDDALDFTGSLASLGKPALNDIAQGLVTAPVLFAAEQHPGMHRLMDRKFSHPGDVQQAVAWVEQSGGVARTKALAAEHCSLAVQAVQAMPAASTDPIPHSPFRIPHSASPIPRSPFRIPHSAFPIPQAPFRFPHSAFPIPHSPSRIPHPAFPTPHSPFRIPHPAFPIPHSPFRIPHSPFPIPHSPSRIPHPAFPIPHSPSRIPHPAFPIPHSPFRIPLPRSPFRVPPSASNPSANLRLYGRGGGGKGGGGKNKRAAFHIQPSAIPLSRSPFRQPPSAFRLLPSPFRIPPSAFQLPRFPFLIPPSALPLPHSPFRPPPSAFPLPPSPFRIPPSAFPLPHPPLRIPPSTFPLPHSPFRIPPFSPPCLMFPPILSPCFPHTAGPRCQGECIAANSNVWSTHQQGNLVPDHTLTQPLTSSFPSLPFPSKVPRCQGAVVRASLRTAVCEVHASKGTSVQNTLTHIRMSHPLFPLSPSLSWLGGECIAALSSVWSAHQHGNLSARTILLAFSRHILVSLPTLLVFSLCIGAQHSSPGAGGGVPDWAAVERGIRGAGGGLLRAGRGWEGLEGDGNGWKGMGGSACPYVVDKEWPIITTLPFRALACSMEQEEPFLFTLGLHSVYIYYQ
ncbi:unnamed protein product [Closterium sp. Naga37s-1]|nr:unnamed protein product [Closterium sp. Naga37s-1]